MITNFKIFENRYIDNDGCVLIRPYSIFGNYEKQNILNVFRYIKEKNIEYKLFHDADYKGDFFIIWFPKFNFDYSNEENKKFLYDDLNEEWYLPSINDDGVQIKRFSISNYYKKFINKCEEIKIESPEDLEIILTSKKYNL